MGNKNLKKTVSYLISLAVILLLWSLIALAVNSELVFPSPELVFFRFCRLLSEKVFWSYFFYTFFRILFSFLFTVITGSLIGFLCGFSEFAEDFFQLPIQILRTTPVIAIILIVIFWFESDFIPVFICSLMTLPVMITSVTTGFKQTDKGIEDLAFVCGLKKYQYYLYIKFPLCFPYFINGALQTFGLSWKVVLAAEVLCLPKKSIGNLLQKAQMNLETADLFAITIFVVAVSFILEKCAAIGFKKIQKNRFIEKQ
ncbi:MAG: ABC transporter permease subunit [Treponema sp.]|nr:ABC transporter permease subunit [Treponema sp.]